MKVANKSSPKGISHNEAEWLTALERYDLAPKLYEEGEGYIISEYIEGDRIMGWIEKHDTEDIKNVLKEVLQQCRLLDKLKVNKKELQRPVKHIIISKSVKMIDFERAKRTDKPKNVTQFCQFLTSQNMKDLLEKKRIFLDKEKLIILLVEYKKEQSEKNFKKILNLLNS
ncbi:hypothetical protein FJZ53_00870 [Candidatus Woesearchaeota archaeon]|nr:hypothetical protein [Candidatus Woesearchaeota archaeon]